jgi:glycosyltransferase involved in cell wall biosynthesis
MSAPGPQIHINVCICTFKRPALLHRLLTKLADQSTENLFTYSIVVVDNDPVQSARNVVAEFASNSGLDVRYCTEHEPNIALARNLAIKNAEGSLIAFLDDDEFPQSDWLCNLFKTLRTYRANGVLGPVKPHFDSEPPVWLKRGKFFDRPEYPTGQRIHWTESRTGNLLFERAILDGIDTPFAPEFGAAGEDRDFFRRMAEKGFTFVWCRDAAVFESVPPSRCTRSYLLRRALLRGSNFGRIPAGRIQNSLKSLLAVPAYAVILPVLALIGHHLFVRYLIKLCDHASRLLSVVGLRVVTQRET